MKLNEFNIEKTMLDYQSHKFDEMKEIVNETIKENKTLDNTIDIQKIKIDMLENEKQQLISFLKDKIRELNYNIYKYDTWHEVGENKEFMKLQVGIYQEVLDFVNKGGKDE